MREEEKEELARLEKNISWSSRAIVGLLVVAGFTFGVMVISFRFKADIRKCEACLMSTEQKLTSTRQELVSIKQKLEIAKKETEEANTARTLCAVKRMRLLQGR